MNWDAISGIAELVGASGVIGSLIYVGFQIRQNTTATRRTNARSTASVIGSVYDTLIAADVAEIFVRGSQDLQALDAVERYRFDLAMVRWLQAIEQAYLDYRDDLYPQEVFDTYRQNIPGVLNSPGGSEWWNQRDAWFTADFRAHVEQLLLAPGPEAAKAGIQPPQEAK